MGDEADRARDEELAHETIDIILARRRRKSKDPHNDYRIDRTIWWVTKDKQVIEIIKMEDSHLVNTIHWMLRSVSAYAEKITYINRQMASLDAEGTARYEYSERFRSDAEYSVSERFRAAREKWTSFDPMINEAIRRGLINNFARA